MAGGLRENPRNGAATRGRRVVVVVLFVCRDVLRFAPPSIPLNELEEERKTKAEMEEGGKKREKKKRKKQAERERGIRDRGARMCKVR